MTVRGRPGEWPVSEFAGSSLATTVAINGNEVFENGIQKNLKIIDLTGAGDLFAAGFLHGYINKLSTKECLEKGTEMSSKIIQQIGARL